MTSVRIERDGDGTYTAHNGRGAVLRIAGDNFSPVELLLAADSFEVVVDAEKIKDETGGNRLKDVTVTFRIAFPEGVHGDEARAILPDIVRKSHDRLCTVSRTVALGTPVTSVIEP
jgi:putative redox protein